MYRGSYPSRPLRTSWWDARFQNWNRLSRRSKRRFLCSLTLLTTCAVLGRAFISDADARSIVLPQALAKLNNVKKELKDLALMKQHATSVSKIIKDIERVGQEVKNLETDLEATGSTRTAEDVQSQLNDVSANLSVVLLVSCATMPGVLIASGVADPMSVNARHSKMRRRELIML